MLGRMDFYLAASVAADRKLFSAFAVEVRSVLTAG